MIAGISSALGTLLVAPVMAAPVGLAAGYFTYTIMSDVDNHRRHGEALNYYEQQRQPMSNLKF